MDVNSPFILLEDAPSSVVSLMIMLILLLILYTLLMKMRHSKLVATGRMVAITGCDSGVGFSAALHCYNSGFTVIALVLNEESSGAQELAQLNKKKKRIHVIYMDVTKVETVKKAVRRVEGILTSSKDLLFHGLVNNAGVMIFGETEWQTDHTVDVQLAVNLAGPITVTRLFAPLLRKYKGRLINVSSHCAFLPLPGFSVYAGTKAGLQAWSDGLRVEWSKYGISVITLLPGAFVSQTNLMSQQEIHATAMLEAMTPEAKAFYRNYFSLCQTYMCMLAGYRPAATVSCNLFYSLLDDALLSTRPKSSYEITPWRYWFYHTVALSTLTPVALRDWLAYRFTSLPLYTPSA